MAIEIERKFLVRAQAWERAHAGVAGTRFRQGYLSTEANRTVRVRVAGGEAWLTIKGEPQGKARLSRLEFEYKIPVQDAHILLDELATGIVIDKVRRVLDVGGTVWELDEFHGANAGLLVAEVELAAEDAPFVKPDWLGDEVSADARFANSRLSSVPFSEWTAVDKERVRLGIAPDLPG